MKRILLLVCALPCLLSAQNAKMRIELKEKTSIQQVVSKSLSAEKLNQVRILAGTNENLPDSVYAYSDEEKTELKRKTYFTYNEEGLPTEEISISFQKDTSGESDDFLPFDQTKTVYTYTSKDGQVTVEEISFLRYNDTEEWEEDGKMMYVFDESDIVNPIEICSYWWDSDEGEWIPEMHFIAVEFDDANRPTVYEMEVTFYDEDDNVILVTLRMEVTYNEDGLIEDRSLFYPTGDPEEPWFLALKEENTYNEDLQLIQNVQNYLDEGFSVTTLFKYDEKGNESYMKVMFEYEGGEDWGEDFEEFYDNFYPDTEGDTDDFYYTEEYDGVYLGEMTLNINAFPVDPSIINLSLSDVTLELSEGSLVFPGIAILKVGDPVVLVFEDVLFNEDGNFQAPDVPKSMLDFPLVFSIIKSSSSVSGDEITLTMLMVDGMTGTLADVEIIYTGTIQDMSNNYTILEVEKKIIGYYNFSGQKLDREPESGLYIILYDNNTSKKVIKLRNLP